mmetsp:Transcript_23301/g.92421  ORF Transcript_23301/g.92421 Transcript_23301/m.92421 type:complete len:273 (-) Transcript_23301:7-825(-)
MTYIPSRDYLERLPPCRSESTSRRRTTTMSSETLRRRKHSTSVLEEQLVSRRFTSPSSARMTAHSSSPLAHHRADSLPFFFLSFEARQCGPGFVFVDEIAGVPAAIAVRVHDTVLPLRPLELLALRHRELLALVELEQVVDVVRRARRGREARRLVGLARFGQGRQRVAARLRVRAELLVVGDVDVRRGHRDVFGDEEVAEIPPGDGHDAPRLLDAALDLVVLQEQGLPRRLGPCGAQEGRRSREAARAAPEAAPGEHHRTARHHVSGACGP